MHPLSQLIKNDWKPALGVAAGNRERVLESPADMTPADNTEAQKPVEEGSLHGEFSGMAGYEKTIVEIFEKTAERTATYGGYLQTGNPDTHGRWL